LKRKKINGIDSINITENNVLRFNNYDWISAKLSKKKDEEKEKSFMCG